MQITIERPQDYPLADWLTCCTQAYRAALLNDMDLTVDEQEACYRTGQPDWITGVFAYRVKIGEPYQFLDIIGDAEALRLWCADSFSSPDTQSELDRVVTEIRVCLP